MAQNITIAGASFPNVPALTCPKTGGGTASFYDISDTTLTAGNAAAGSYFYTAAGVKTAGSMANGNLSTYGTAIPATVGQAMVGLSKV